MTRWSAAVAAVAAGCMVGGVLLARRRYLVVTVRGSSMTPTFADGERVLVRRTGRRDPHRGEVVVLRPPLSAAGQGPDEPVVHRPPGGLGGWAIKRVVAVPGDPLPEAAAQACGLAAGTPVPAGAFVVFGDGPVSWDSRGWGLLPADLLRGVVLRRVVPGGGRAAVSR